MAQAGQLNQDSSKGDLNKEAEWRYCEGRNTGIKCTWVMGKRKQSPTMPRLGAHQGFNWCFPLQLLISWHSTMTVRAHWRVCPSGGPQQSHIQWLVMQMWHLLHPNTKTTSTVYQVEKARGQPSKNPIRNCGSPMNLAYELRWVTLITELLNPHQ